MSVDTGKNAISSNANEGSPTTQSTTEISKCAACADQLARNELITLACSDLYCSSCLSTLVRTAVKDETMFPPQCCSYPVSTKIAKKHLPARLYRLLQAKQQEFGTRHKVYCHVPKCSAFIAPHSIHNGHAVCRRCRAITCSKCNSAWHYGPCATTGDTTLTELHRAQKWQRCPECKRIVEKWGGCDHIV